MAGRNVRPLVCLGILLIYCEYTELDMDSVKNEQFNKSIGKTFIKYLLAAFGAVLTTSIYAFVDTVVIGQYEGEVGTAAVSCVMPIWNVFIGTGILFGIGGSVMYSVTRGKGEARKANAFFTASFIACVAVAAVLYVVFLVFQREILWFFGAKETAVLEKAQLYVGWIAYVMPLFVLGQYFIAFIRNDGNPVLTTVAVVSGGAFNIFGDIFNRSEYIRYVCFPLSRFGGFYIGHERPGYDRVTRLVRMQSVGGVFPYEPSGAVVQNGVYVRINVSARLRARGYQRVQLRNERRHALRVRSTPIGIYGIHRLYDDIRLGERGTYL